MDKANIRLYCMPSKHYEEDIVPGKSEARNGRILLLLLMAALFIIVSVAAARAGGGNRYGGSGGYGGGGSGGGGLGYLFYFLIRLAIVKPVVGVPLLIAGAVFVIKFGKGTKSGYQAYTINKAEKLRKRQSREEMQKALEALKRRDPGFTANDFLAKVDKAFTAVQEAWSNQDMEPVRRFISDGIDERFKLQIEMQKAEGYRNRMENVTVLASRIVGVYSDRHFDTIHVEIRARADDSDVDLKTGKTIRKNSSDTFTEYWSFLRKPGAQTLEGKSLIEGFCPNCGAALEITDTGRCGNCGSYITSGEYDWVLTEITQSMEWNVLGDKSLIPGYLTMSSLDPGFNVQHVEDRTSVIFWRLMKSWFIGDVSPAGKVTLPSFLDDLRKQIDNTREDNGRLFFKDAAVGAVEVQRIIPGAEGDFDRIEVLVKWSGINARLNEDGKIRVTGGKMMRPQVYTLVRKHGVTTPAGQSFRSSHCPGCGAPYEGGDSGTCDYCGRRLNDGSQDWVLEKVERFSASRITADTVNGIKRASLVPPEILLSAMAAAMYADGKVDDREMRVLETFAARHGISGRQLAETMEAVKNGSDELPVPGDTKEAREILSAMARIVLSDGKMTDTEKRFLRDFGESQGLAWADVKLVIARQKALLYAEAKKMLRGS